MAPRVDCRGSGTGFQDLRRHVWGRKYVLRGLATRIGGGDREQGFSLVEVMVAVVLLSVCLIGMAQFFASAGDRVMDSETRSLLHQIASQEIEDIRALPYEDIGVEGGNPAGALEASEDKTVEDLSVRITREIRYVTDASYSGPYPANYRRVTIIVRATGYDDLDPMQLSTIIAGGAEGGALDITVTNLAGEPVADASLQITNDHLLPHVDIHDSATRTDSQGHLLVPGLEPDDTNSYYVVATKSGYDSAATPEGQVVVKGTPFTVVQLIIDELSTLTIHLTNGSGAPLAGVALTLTGYLSFDPWTFSQEVITDENGYATLENIRYATSLQPYIIQTSAAYDPVLQLPLGVDPDPVDASITLGPGQVGLLLDPGTDRSVELELPPGE